MATSFDFVSSGGQFSILNDELSFGNGLTISAASDDTDLVGSRILFSEAIMLTGNVQDLPGGVSLVEIAPGQSLSLSIVEAVEDGGDVLATASYSAGDFIVVGAGGIVSGAIGPDLTDIMLTQAGMGFSTTLDALAASTLPIDFNVTLSAAGQDIAQRVASGSLVLGSVAGSVAVVPEPSTALLLGLGLLALGARQGTRPGKNA